MAAQMIDPLLYGSLTAVAVVTGFIDSIAGGGGLIMMPTLLFAGLPPHIALGTNKLQSICGTTMAAYRYRRAGLFRVRPNLLVVGVVFIAALLGAVAILWIDGKALSLLVPVLLLAVALYTVFSPRMEDHESEPRITDRQYLPLAGGIGFYDGFFGPGTGSFFAVSLVGLRGFGLTRATGLAKLLNLTSNAASLVVFALSRQINLPLGLCMALGAMTGAWLGAHSATRFGAKLIRPLLITASLALTGKLIWSWFAG